jgi:hypothetical protein
MSANREAATRRLLLATGTAAFLGGIAALPARSAMATDLTAARGRRLAGLLTRPDTARDIAAAYLAGIGETDARRAAAALDMEAVLAPLDDMAGTSASREFLGARIRADFAAGAVLDVDGWRLSRTEVGACLLVASVV